MAENFSKMGLESTISLTYMMLSFSGLLEF